MKHEYTDEEIKTAWTGTVLWHGEARSFEDRLRAFLSALPTRERPQPWPGQQEAIDAATVEAAKSHPHCYGSLSAQPVTGGYIWTREAPARLAIAQAYDAARPQAAEIAALKAALAESEKQFQDKVYEIARLLDECDKAQGILKACLSVMPFGNLETHTFENLPGRIADLASEIASLSLENERLETELAALRQSTQSAQPILADDGRRLGQVAMKASFDADTEGLTVDECYEAAAKAVVAAARPAIEAECLAQAVRRMEAVTAVEVADIIRKTWLERGAWIDPAAEAIRARLIAAAKGEGQAVVVNQPPQDDKQPDLPLKSEKQPEEPAWILHDGGPCPLKDEEVEEWEFQYRPASKDSASDERGVTVSPSRFRWSHHLNKSDIIAYRVLKWKPGFGQEAQAQQAEAQPTTSPGWTPAVGDTVRLKSGGPVMTVHYVANDGLSHCVCSINGAAFNFSTIPAACLTPAKP